MRALLVATVGGHLTQLHQLRPRLPGVDDVTWVTFDTPQARSLLAGERVLFARHTEPRDLAGVLRNTAMAARLLRSGGYGVVVSTGSGIALSFLPAASALGVPSRYIESATRTTGPSLTGRLLRRVPGIGLYTQSPAWADGTWRYAGSVFDGFSARLVRRPATITSAVVTLGTMRTYGFRRLLERLVQVLPPGTRTIWQTGCTDTTGLPIDPRPALGARELAAAIAAADVVVAHAGTGSALTALEAGKLPVLVPRRRVLGENVDDHQAEVAADLAARGLALHLSPDTLELDQLLAAAAHVVDRVERAPVLDLGQGPCQTRREHDLGE